MTSCFGLKCFFSDIDDKVHIYTCTPDSSSYHLSMECLSFTCGHLSMYGMIILRLVSMASCINGPVLIFL